MEQMKRNNTTEYVVKTTREYLDSILVEERLIDSGIPSIEMELFGETFSSPIMTPAFSHLTTFAPGQQDGLVEYSKAMRELNQVNWIGMGENDELERVAQTGARTVKIVKPYADRKKIFDQIAFAEAHGAFAVGVDIDHSFAGDGTYDVVMGEKMIGQSSGDIAELVRSTRLPFIVKGVLSVSDALKCAECGAAGIVVSHHHGRMPYAIPPLMVLPDIVEAVGDSVKIFVDCGIDTGSDAFKALALGADAVCVGRAVMPALQKDGCRSVVDYVTKMNDELRMMMAFTGFRKLDEIEESVLWM